MSEKKESVTGKEVNRRSILKWTGGLAVAVVAAVAGATELLKPPPVSFKPPLSQTGTSNPAIQTQQSTVTSQSISSQQSTVNSSTVSTVSNSVQTSATVFNPTGQNIRLLAKASDIPLNDSLTLKDETFDLIILIHLDNGQFVAYSAICTHAGCQVSFDQRIKDITCACHGSVFDPYNNAQVVGGPAPIPLPHIAIQYDPATGNIYLAG